MPLAIYIIKLVHVCMCIQTLILTLRLMDSPLIIHLGIMNPFDIVYKPHDLLCFLYLHVLLLLYATASAL